MLLGHARGKVGDLVFSRTNGQQVVRARAAVVKNPQTEAQMIQRIIMNTVAQSYSKMQPIVDHSFEGMQAGQKTMSEYIRKNLHVLRQKVAAAVADPTVGLTEVRAFTPIGNNGFAVNDFIVSSGSLPSIVPEVADTLATSATVAIGGNTYADVINSYGLQRGDQLTFCCITGVSALNARFNYSRIILDPTNQDGTPAPLSVALVADGAVNLPSERNTGTFSTLAVDGQGVLSFNSDDALRQIQGCFIIVSRKSTDGTWKRSNATVVTSETSVVDGYSMQECLDLFAEGGVGTLSDMFLNNAGQGAVASSAAAVSTVQWVTPLGYPVMCVGLMHEMAYAEGVSPSEQRDFFFVVDAGGGRWPLRNITNENSPKYGYYQLFNENEEYEGSQQKPDGVGAHFLDLTSLDSEQAAWLYAKGLHREQLTLPVD